MYIDALYARMGDPNGNYMRDFQGTGFNARLFELACFAYLESAGFEIDRSFPAPDFIAERNGVTIAFEAVTVNPSEGNDLDISLLPLLRSTEPSIPLDVTIRTTMLRISRALRKKLAHRYDQLSHCKGKPLVLMVAPFSEPGSVFYPDGCLIENLYGTPQNWPKTENILPFFCLDNSTPISSILYCNPFTVSRFIRFATDFRSSQNLIATREGQCFFRDDDLASSFVHHLGATQTPMETWHEGVTLFCNPFASVSIPEGLLPNTCTFSINEDKLLRKIEKFHPVHSITRVQVRNI